MEDGAALFDVVYLAGEMLVILRDVNVLAVSLSRFSFTPLWIGLEFFN